MASSFWPAAAVLALALLLDTGTAGPTAEVANALKNPGFDTGKMSWRGEGRVKDKAEADKAGPAPAGEDEPKAKPAPAKKTDDEGATGTRDGILEIKLSNKKAQEFWQSLRLPGASQYSISFSYRVSPDCEFADKGASEFGAEHGISIQIQTTMDNGSSSTGTSFSPKTGPVWRQYSGTMRHAGYGKDTTFRIRVPRGKGRIWFDDFTVIAE